MTSSDDILRLNRIADEVERRVGAEYADRLRYAGRAELPDVLRDTAKLFPVYWEIAVEIREFADVLEKGTEK